MPHTPTLAQAAPAVHSLGPDPLLLGTGPVRLDHLILVHLSLAGKLYKGKTCSILFTFGLRGMSGVKYHLRRPLLSG